MKTHLQYVAEVEDHPATSFWLKAAIKALEQRDPIDADSDAEVLHQIMRLRLNEILDHERN